MQQFFYSGQIRRFVTQFIRMVSNFQVEFGKDRAGATSLLRVPVIYGDMNRQAAQILKNNSENVLSYTPSMAVYIGGLTYDRERVQEPYHISKVNLRERVYNETLGTFVVNQQDSITVERMMPVPYKLELKLDIWTSNSTQKLQLIEQLCTLFNPSMEIQNTDNYLDWTSLSTVTLTNINFTSRTIPAGAEDQIDIASLTFELPIWISLPAKVKKLGVIQKIIASIYDPKGELDDAAFTDSNMVSRQYITPLQYGIIVLDNTLLLVKDSEIATETGKIGTKDSWPALIDVYGALKPGTSQVRLQLEDEKEIVGTVAFHPTDNSLLLFNIFNDTIPTNTVAPIHAIIDPNDFDIDNQAITTPQTAGVRYLILNDITSSINSDKAEAWLGADGSKFTDGYISESGVVAKENDIIEWNGSKWSVSFKASQNTSVQYVTHLNTAVQYRWNGTEWLKSFQGHYPAGRWSLIL